MAGVEHLTNHLVDRFLMEAAAPDEIAHVARHVAECPACDAKLKEARAEREAFLAKNVPARRAAELLAAAGVGRQRRLAWRWGVPAMASALAVALLVLVVKSYPGGETVPGTPDRAGVLAKGGPGVVWLVTNKSRSWTGQSGEGLAPADALRLRLIPGVMRHAAVVDVDGTGRATLLAAVELNGPRDLPNTLVLDDSPAPERLFVLFSREELPPAEVTAAATNALAAAGNDLTALETFSLPDRPEVIVRSFLVRKVAGAHIPTP